MESTDLVPNGAPAPILTSTGWTREQVDLIKSTVAKGTTDSELQLFLYVCKRTGLDPLIKQIHAVKRWNSADKRETMALQVGIDGYRLIAARTGQHAGTDDAVFDTEDAEHPNKASVTVYRFVGGQRVGFTASARWAEYVQTKREGETTSMWRQMPYLLLAKCSEALALRKAFPAELSGVYTHDEMGQANNEPQQTQAKPPLVMAPKPQDPPPPQSSDPRFITEDPRLITEGQQKRLFPLMRDAKVKTENFKAFLLEQYKHEHMADIVRTEYDQICNDITGGGVTAWVVMNTPEVEAGAEA